MEQERVYQLFQDIQQGKQSPEGALDLWKSETYSDLGFAKVDHGRHRRTGFPEVVYAEGKTVEHLDAIYQEHTKVHNRLLMTRLSQEKYDALQKRGLRGHYNPMGRTLSVVPSDEPEGEGQILILCAGTSDLPVAEEAKETALIMGNAVELVSDVGVAGLHRLLNQMGQIQKAKVIIVIAGMEGALASVVGGLVQVPVVAVPTSIGYGASFQGVAALLAMLNSCAPGITVVNIDNGFGAAFAASLINNPVK